MRNNRLATVAGLALLTPALAACAAPQEKLEPWQQAQKTEVWSRSRSGRNAGWQRRRLMPLSCLTVPTCRPGNR